MKQSIAPTLSAFVLASGLMCGSATLQSQTTSHSSVQHRTSASITGCLRKGDEADEYSMKTTDGKLYGLTSRKIALKHHVGHLVTLHGYITPESAEKPEPGSSPTQPPDVGDIDMTVTSLKMISITCK